MRKLVKLMTTATVLSVTAMQVIACKDDTKFNMFTSDVNETLKNSSAFLGFLGSADDSLSLLMQNAFSYFNQKDNDSNEKTRLQEWNNEISNELKQKKIKNITLKYYQGPYHQNKPNDVVEDFWKDKSISWQRSIFDWLLYNSKATNNPGFKTPSGADAYIKPIETKKDGDKEMFQKLPIVFIVSKGKLITAGQGWNSSQEPNIQLEAIKNFILTNLLM